MFGMVVLGLVLGALFTVGAACLWSRRHPNKPMLSLLGNQGPMPGLPPLASPMLELNAWNAPIVNSPLQGSVAQGQSAEPVQA